MPAAVSFDFRRRCSAPGSGMNAIPEPLIEKLKALPPQCLTEVEGFVDALMTRDRSSAADWLGSAMDRLDALGGAPMPQEEVQAEVAAARAGRQKRGTERR
jgi:hypothetical protein